MLNLSTGDLLSRFDRETGTVDGVASIPRYLSDMRGYFADEAAYMLAMEAGDPLVYTVTAVAPDEGDGALHYGIGRIMPGRVGDEFFMTKGHFHAWRPAAEYYIGLQGSGVMLLEDESGAESRMVPLTPDRAVYVPGHTAHRTVNTGVEPLVYLGIYPARAGHDYGVIAQRNFHSVVIERGGAPRQLDRCEFLAGIGRRDGGR